MYEIPEYLDREAFDHILHISLRNRYTYFWVPKVASTYILECLYQLEVHQTTGPHPSDPWKGMRRYALPKQTHDRAGSPLFMPSLLPDEIVREALFGDSFFRFAFVREPVRRGLSAYYDKIYRPTDIRERFCALAGIKDTGGDGFLSEEDYVALLPKIPRPVLDLHLRPQVEILMANNGVKMDFVGGPHDVTGGLQTVFDRLNVDFKPIAEAPWMREHSTKEIQQTRKFSEVALAGLETFLAEDIAFFARLELGHG